MTEGSLIDLIYRLIITPVVGWILYKLQKREAAAEEMEHRIAALEKEGAITKVMYDNVMSHVIEIKSSLKEIAENMRYLERRRQDDRKD